ncbi:hypothetical protein AX15_001229 [Amanita polypyramis BW_CC]|nr:hypothetical protein AX15_001229 [Amanita polypyramis BW_CC]
MPLLSLSLGTLLLALAVTAKPIVFKDLPVTLPITRRLNGNSTHNLLQRDQARARHLMNRGFAKEMSTAQTPSVFHDAVDNKAVTYTASIGVGTPPNTYDLIIDTGSSNTWVGADKMFSPTNSTRNTLRPVEVTYGSGFFVGLEVLDAVNIAPGLTLQNQSIGVALLSQGFDGVDGILGLGPVDLTEGTVLFEDGAIPTVTDNACNQGFLANCEVGISFEPTTVPESRNGEIAYGGVNDAKYTGNINYVSVTGTEPASKYWGIDQSITYGQSQLLGNTAGIVDTGTTLILIATDAFNRYRDATGGEPDSATGLLKITPGQFANLKSLYFNINGVPHEIVPDAQIWPRALNSYIGGSSDYLYLIVNDLRSNSGEGLDFINGFTFLERYYSVYDNASRRVGLATTSFTLSKVNNP